MHFTITCIKKIICHTKDFVISRSTLNIVHHILTGMAYNFHKYDTNRIDSRGVSYDYDSIMHYSSTAFANRQGVRTIVGKNGRTNLGQRYGLSKKDIQQANLLYCGAQPPVTNRPPTPPKPDTPPPPGKTEKCMNLCPSHQRLESDFSFCSTRLREI